MITIWLILLYFVFLGEGSEHVWIDESYSGKVEKILIEEMAIIRKRIREIV
jgi:hypothetical protein